MWPNLQETADWVTFIEKILKRKIHFLCIVRFSSCIRIFPNGSGNAFLWISLTLFRMALFSAAQGWGVKKASSLKYPKMMKLGTVIRYQNHVTRFLSSAEISIFYRKWAAFVISRNTVIHCIFIHNF